MSGCQNFPIDVDGSVGVTPGTVPEIPINVDTPTPIYNLAMNVNIIRGGSSAITCNHISNVVIPYVNGIWANAGINIYLKSCRCVTSIPNCNPTATKPAERVFNRRFLTDQESYLNVFIVPETLFINSAGYTVTRYTGEGYIVMGEMANNRRWNLGRFSNILSHEIGHMLGIKNHNPDPKFLMHYKNAHWNDPYPGNENSLSYNEIQIARFYAARGIIPWNFDIPFFG